MKVIDQATRRVIKGEKVPASEKVVSFFEEHTDIIVKGRRDTQYGHKIFLTGGASNLILDCLIERGNPADSDRYQDLLERHEEQFGRAPRQVSADGGFASRNNLAFAKGREVKDAVFAKKRGLSVIEMAKSAWVYKMLRNFRAGIEAVPKAMVEAAESLGYSRGQIFRKVVLPLAVRVTMPAMTNNLVNLVKTTTLAYAIAVPELLYMSAQVWSEQVNVPEMMVVLLICYVAIVGIINQLMQWLEARLRVPGFGQ
jgi:IS5 family transposase